MYSRIQANEYIQILCDASGFDFPDIGENEDENTNAVIYKTAIEAYVEILGLTPTSSLW